MRMGLQTWRFRVFWNCPSVGSVFALIALASAVVVLDVASSAEGACSAEEREWLQDAEQKEGAPRISVASAQMLPSLAHELMVFVMDEPSFRELCAKLKLSLAQQRDADALFLAYQIRVQAIETSIAKTLEPVVPLFTSLELIPREERNGQTSIHLALADCFGKAFHEAESAMRSAMGNFESSLLASLTEAQALLASCATRDWRRSVMLNRGNDHTRGVFDLAAHVDVGRVLDASECEGRAVSAWIAESDGEPASNAQERVDRQKTVALVVEQYHLELDAQLTRRFWSDIEDHDRARIAAMRGDGERRTQLWNKISQRWMEVFRVNERFARVLEDLMKRSGDLSAASEWRQRFSAEYFPFTYASKSADAAYDWIVRSNPEMTSLAEVHRIYSAHCAQREELRTVLMQRLIERCGTSADAHGEAISLRNSGDLDCIRSTLDRLRVMNDSMVHALGCCLDIEHATEFDRVLAAAKVSSIAGERMEY